MTVRRMALAAALLLVLAGCAPAGTDGHDGLQGRRGDAGAPEGAATPGDAGTPGATGQAPPDGPGKGAADGSVPEGTGSGHTGGAVREGPGSGDAGETIPGDSPPSRCPPEASDPFAAAPAPGLFERSSLPAGAVIAEPGAYFLHVTTGEVEAWRPVQHAGAIDLARMRTDLPGWLALPGREMGVLVRRADGAAYCWRQDQWRLLAGNEEALLFEGPPGTYTLTGADLKPQHTFSLAHGGQAQARFSPDGRQVVINPWRTGAQGEGPLLYVVDVDTGAAQAVGERPGADGASIEAVELQPGLVVRISLQHRGQGERHLVRRYGWDGSLLWEREVGSPGAALSPDGRLLAWEEKLGAIGHAVVVQDVATGEPLFRVLGARAVRWLADGSAFVAYTEPDPILVTAAGDLREAAPGVVDDWYMTTLYPSPADPDRFLVRSPLTGAGWAGLKVVDGSGRTAIEVPFGEESLGLMAGWTPSGQEVAFSLREVGGMGFPGPLFSLTPAVDFPPFAERFLLQVRDPAGECLNLREAPSTDSRVIRCLPSGTPLAVGRPTEEEQMGPLLGLMPMEGEKPWLVVETPDGERGWVALFTGSVTWAVEP